jgi:hypothetical protein
MSTRIQRRGGTAAEHESFIGAPREITVDTTNNTLRLHDGTTAGGHPAVMKRDAGEFGGFRNKIINGDFEIWQRGETGFASAGYCADRWYWRPSTGGTGTVLKSGVNLGGVAEIPGNPRHYAYIDHTVAGTESCYLEQRIEGVETLAGQEATVTAYVRPDAMTDVAVGLVQSFGTGGSPSAEVYSEIQPATSYPSGWSKIQVRFTLPSVAGKTLGSDGNDYVALRFSFDPTAVFTVRMTHVSFVRGDATAEGDPFEARHKQQELALCQRYYRRLGIGLSGAIASAAQVIFHSNFENPMRKAPTVTLLDSAPYIGSAGNTYVGSSSAIDDSGSSKLGFLARVNGFSGLSGGFIAYVRQSEDVIALDAEL